MKVIEFLFIVTLAELCKIGEGPVFSFGEI